MTDRSLLVSGPIEDMTLRRVWHAVNVPDGLSSFTLCLNTEGGSFPAACAIVDLLQDLCLERALTTIGLGEVCSAGVPILACGGRRLLYPNTFVGVHEPIVCGDPDSPAIAASHEALRAQLAHKYYALLERFSKHTKKWWRKRIRGKDLLYVDAQEAVKLGLADEVIGD